MITRDKSREICASWCARVSVHISSQVCVNGESLSDRGVQRRRKQHVITVINLCDSQSMKVQDAERNYLSIESVKHNNIS